MNSDVQAQTLLSTLVIDIGGTRIKMMVIDGKKLSILDYVSELTPRPAHVDAVCQVISQMLASFHQKYHRVSAGFPGVVQDGIIKTAPNMDSSWLGLHFEKKLQDITERPTKIINDADLQGFGYIKRSGVELVITLGTGLGSALFSDGKLTPNLELGHHPFHDDYTYEQRLGKAAIEKLGLDEWNIELKRAINLWSQTFNYSKLYLSGGYSENITLALPRFVEIPKNVEGLRGGVALWELI